MELDRDLGTIQSAVHSARAKWYNIGLQLQIPVDKLDSTKVDWHGDTGDCLRETLKAWLKRVNPPPDWKDIVNALKSGPVDECKLAEELNANYCSRSDVSRKLPLSEQKTQTPVVHSPPSLGVAEEMSSPIHRQELGHSSGTSLDTENFSHQQDFTCGCGQCTLSSWLEKGCPNASDQNRKYPYLDLDRLSKKERRALEVQLDGECKKIEIKFGTLVFRTKESLISQNVSVKKLASCLIDLKTYKAVYPNKPVLFHRLDDILNAKDIDEVFLILSDYRSFFNYHIIEYIIDMLGTIEDKERLCTYKEELKYFLKRRIFECPENVCKQLDGDYKEDLVVKIGQSQYETELCMMEISSYQQTVSDILGLNIVSLLLCHITKGCVQLTFQIPYFVVADGKTFPLDSKQMDALKANGITSLKCGNFDWTKCEPNPEIDQKEVVLVETEALSLSTEEFKLGVPANSSGYRPGMNQYAKTCKALVDKCKKETQQLAEFATMKKFHWTHPRFISFCVSVEDVLSYGVRQCYQSNESKQFTSSMKILRELGKTNEDAGNIHSKCFKAELRGAQEEKEGYAMLQTNTPAERKVLWISTALVEGKLRSIMNEIMEDPRHYYSEESVLCHEVYGHIFSYLLDGPIQFIHPKNSDKAILSPTPAEIVDTHKKALSNSLTMSHQDGHQTHHGQRAMKETWHHMRSLYQNSLYTCLFGKNHILRQPPGFMEPLQGYLTLQQGVTSLLLKWIPNSLLKDSKSSGKNPLWEHVLSVEIRSVAHLHCHKVPGSSAELILIGYDGIAYPPIIFTHQPSLFLFLECLENSLLPHGSLEPPLWYLKTQGRKTLCPMINQQLGSLSDGVEGEGGKEWWKKVGVWNQVFRVRCGGRTAEIQEESEQVIRAPLPPHLSLDMTQCPPTHPVEASDSSSDSEADSIDVTVGKPGSLVRSDWEKFQSNVSRQLLARYFYSWLSYRRHMNRARENIAHMLETGMAFPQEYARYSRPQGLNEECWKEFLKSKERNEKWAEIMRVVYLEGMRHQLRAEVWPYLLGLYPVDCSDEEKTSIKKQCEKQYDTVLSNWKHDETLQKEIEALMPRTLSNDEVGHPTRGDPENPPKCLDHEEELLQLGLLVPQQRLASDGRLSDSKSVFLEELVKIDKDILCFDHDYWYFKELANLEKLRNIVSSYVWTHLDMGYSQGMCDLLAPLLVVLDSEPLAYACFLRLMDTAINLFPPNHGMEAKMNNLRALLKVQEPDYFQYLTERPMGDGLVYTYRWFLVCFKRELGYSEIFRLWETIWAARNGSISQHFEEFFALAIMQQFMTAIMDAYLDPSDILDLFTDLAEKRAIDCIDTIRLAQDTITDLETLTRKDD